VSRDVACKLQTILRDTASSWDCVRGIFGRTGNSSNFSQSGNRRVIRQRCRARLFQALGALPRIAQISDRDRPPSSGRIVARTSGYPNALRGLIYLLPPWSASGASRSPCCRPRSAPARTPSWPRRGARPPRGHDSARCSARPLYRDQPRAGPVTARVEVERRHRRRDREHGALLSHPLPDRAGGAGVKEEIRRGVRGLLRARPALVVGQ